MGSGFNLSIHNMTNVEVYIKDDSRNTGVKNIDKLSNKFLPPGQEIGSYLELKNGSSIFYLQVKTSKAEQYDIGCIHIPPGGTEVVVCPFLDGTTKKGVWKTYAMCAFYIYPGTNPNNYGNHVYIRPMTDFPSLG